MSRSVTRVNTTQRKQREAREQNETTNLVQEEIKFLTNTQKENKEKLKVLKENLAGSKRRKSLSSSKAESSSSGRVRSEPGSLTLKGKKACVATAWKAHKVNEKKREFKFNLSVILV